MNFEVAPKTTEIQATWDEAVMYCFFLEIDGKKGWRLPTKEELDYIYHSKNDFIDAYYWSSTEYNGSSAWGQVFTSGTQFSSSKNGGSYYVRAIRDII
jgi:formylglycine-generating enzyme required for sulfatase activity